MSNSFYDQENLSKFTLNLDFSSIVRLEEIALSLRRLGYTRMSRGFLISAASNHIVNVYERGGMEAVLEIIQVHLDKFSELKGLTKKEDKKEEEKPQTILRRKKDDVI